MGGPAETKARREPGFGDYLKAAFNVRVKVPGLGGVPVNWLYVTAVAGLSVAAWPMLLVGAAGEIVLLTTLATSARFQRAVRAQLQTQAGNSTEAALLAMATGLSAQGRARYDAFSAKCDDVLDIAGRLGQTGGGALETYATHLAELRAVYARMLVFSELLSRYSRDWDKTDPQREIEQIEKSIASGRLPEAVVASRRATIEVLKRRAESRQAVWQRAGVLQSEMERLEQQVALLRDQALLTRDPAVFSQSMDLAAGALEEHNSWLQENEAFLQSLGDANLTA